MFKVCNVILDERRINQTWEHHRYLDLQHKTINIWNKVIIFDNWDSYLVPIYRNCIWYLLNQTYFNIYSNACSNIKLCWGDNLFWSENCKCSSNFANPKILEQSQISFGLSRLAQNNIQ